VKKQAKLKHCEAFNPARQSPLHSSFHARSSAVLCTAHKSAPLHIRTMAGRLSQPKAAVDNCSNLELVSQAPPAVVWGTKP
jgi:hypothetical protein